MSEARKPCLVFVRRLPQNRGKKSPEIYQTIVELFPAERWRGYWQPYSPHRDRFYPIVPLRSGDRDEYFASRYRVRVNGRWLKDKARYQMLTIGQIQRRYLHG